MWSITLADWTSSSSSNAALLDKQASQRGSSKTDTFGCHLNKI